MLTHNMYTSILFKLLEPNQFYKFVPFDHIDHEAIVFYKLSLFLIQYPTKIDPNHTNWYWYGALDFVVNIGMIYI